MLIESKDSAMSAYKVDRTHPVLVRLVLQKRNLMLISHEINSFYFSPNFPVLPFRWTDVTGVEKSNNLVAPDTIRISTRESVFQFGMFVRRSSEAFDLISQLANLVSQSFSLICPHQKPDQSAYL